MKTDIRNREDIARLITAFYDKLLKDELLRPIFVDVAGIDLEEHLPILYDFWETVLFQTGKYRRNTLQVHLDLHRKHPLEEIHFDRWLGLFAETVDELFEGEKAWQAKESAVSIARIMMTKIRGLP